MITINKDLLRNYRFSDNPNAWILEAEGFKNSAHLLLQSQKNPSHPRPKFVAMSETNLHSSTNKIACYLYSVAIELFLKALYSLTKTPEDQEKTESFSHNVKKLNQTLIAKGILQTDELDQQALELANIMLAWYGRYFKPQPDKIENVIKSCFEEVPEQPGMLKSKFSINSETTAKLECTATLLSSKVRVNPASIDFLLFSSF